MAGDKLTTIRAALTDHASGRRGRSTLFRWLLEHADEFAILLTETQASWQAVAEALTAADLRDGRGLHPSAERARKTWYGVQQVRTRQPANRPIAPPQPAQPTQPVRMIQPQQPAVPATGREAVERVRASLRQDGRHVPKPMT
jgi:hypothetical protein